MSPRQFLLPSALIAACGLLAPAGLAAEEPRRSPLAGVAALDKPITLSNTRIALGEVVQKVAAETGVKLTAHPTTADEPVAVVVKELPARELLVQLAELLDYLWVRQGKEGAWRYELWQDVAARKREEAAREATFAAVQKQLDEEIRQHVKLAALPPEEVRQLGTEYDRWRQRFFGLPWPQRQKVARVEWAQIRRPRMARRLTSDANRALAVLLGRLTPPQWAQLRKEQPLVLSTHPQPGQLPLPPDIARLLRDARPSMASGHGSSDPAETERERQNQRTMEAQWAAAAGHTVTVRFSTDAKHGSVSLTAGAAPIGSPSAEAYHSAEGTSLRLSVETRNLAEVADTDPAGRETELADDPVLGVKRRFQRQPKPPAPGEPRQRPDGASVRDLLPDIARIYGVSLIADAYWAESAFRAVPNGEEMSLAALLERWPHPDYQWDHHGKLVRLRCRAWPFARPRAVPLRFVRRWEAIERRGGVIPFDELVHAAATLTDLQLESAPQIVYHHALFQLYPGRHMLRLYHSLPVNRQQALWQGRPVMVAEMSPAQRELFLAPLREPEKAPDPFLPSHNPAAAEAAPPSPPQIGPDSRFALGAEHVVRVEAQQGESTILHFEPVAAAPSPAPPPAAQRPGTRPGPRPIPAVRRQPLVRVSLQFLYSPERQERVDLDAAPPGTAVPVEAPAPEGERQP
jgi:hypothetical protein